MMVETSLIFPLEKRILPVEATLRKQDLPIRSRFQCCLVKIE